MTNDDGGKMRYVWSVYCEKPVSEEDHLEAIERLFRRMARVVALEHIGKYCRVCIRAKDSGFPPSSSELERRLIKKGIPIVGTATVYEGDEAVLYTLEMSMVN